jgi:hypothetical protein
MQDFGEFPSFMMVSFVGIDEGLIAKVAEKVDVTPERVRAYLGDPVDQDRDLTHAFLYYGVGPVGKTL